MKTLAILTDRFRRARTARPLTHRARRQPGARAGTRTAPLLWGSILAALLGGIMLSPASHATSRIKDIANFEGVRDNMLVGYGLVVGLNATGDTLPNSSFTKQSLVAMLERLGVNTRDET